MKFLLVFFMELLAILFFLTAIDKLKHWHNHIGNMKSYRIIHGSLIKPLLFLFLIGELFISISLVVTGITLYNSIIFYTLLFTYTSAVLINLVRGNQQISCGCGSVLDSEQLSSILIYRNILIMLIFTFLIYHNEKNVFYHVAYFESIVIGMFALSTLLVYGVIKEYKAHLSLIHKLLSKISENKGGI